MSDSYRALLSVQRWAEIVIQRWQAKIQELDVIDTGSLLKSFQSQVMADAAGDPVKVTFTFLYYGRFSDMGAGGFMERKPWYSQIFLREVNALGRMLATRYGYDAAELTAFNGTVI